MHAYGPVNQYVHTLCRGKSHDKIFDKIFAHILMRLINGKDMRTIILCYCYSKRYLFICDCFSQYSETLCTKMRLADLSNPCIAEQIP